MKRLIILLSLSIGLIAVVSISAYAQSDAPKATTDKKTDTQMKAPEAAKATEQPKQEGVAPVAKKEMPTIDHIYNHMKEKYKLDEKQSSALHQILTETREQAIADRNAATTHEELVALGKTRIEVMNQKIEKILNEDQLKEFRESKDFMRWAHERWEMKQERKMERHERQQEKSEEAAPPKMENNDK